MTAADSSRSAIVGWLCAGDPAVAWQAERDLLGASASVWQSTQSRVATEGWGARLLAQRGKDGRWSGGLYSPKWVSTFYSMRLLYWFGLDGTHPDAVDSCALLLDEGVQPDGGVSLWSSKWTDCCVTAMTVALAVRFGHQADDRVGAMLAWLFDARLPDGGWNCNHGRSGCRVSSFHTTLSVLEALHDIALVDDANREMVQPFLDAGHDYFLRHRVYRSERTGEVVRPSFTKFSFPPRWFFDALRALDHFRAGALPWDDRLDDAIALVETRRRKDGRWNAQNRHTGEVFFRLEPNQPSRWNTLRALRVLDWASMAQEAK